MPQPPPLPIVSDREPEKQWSFPTGFVVAFLSWKVKPKLSYVHISFMSGKVKHDPTGPSPFLQVYYLPDVVGAWFAAPQVESAHKMGEVGGKLQGWGRLGLHFIYSDCFSFEG